MRTVGFLLTEGGISPTAPQYAGVQGEHNATEVLFTLPDVWVERGYAVRAEFVDGVGAFDTTGFLTVSGNLVTVPLPAAWTAAGGMGEIRLAAAQLDEMGLPEQQVVYSAVGYLYFDSREGGNAAAREEREQGLSALIADTQQAAAAANATAEELRQARANGEFDGKEGEKGDTGTQGPKGEPGEPGKDGQDGQAIMPITNVYPRTSGGWPNYRYHYEVYTSWEELPEGFLFSVPLVYGLQSGDGWGVEIFCPGGSAWTAATDNFDGWDIEAGTCLFSYTNGKVTHITGEKGEKGDTGEQGPQGEKGEDGVSPTVSFSEIEGGCRIVFTDASGKRGIDIYDGAAGKSAYAYAQEGGYTGSETDFAEKLAEESLVGTTENTPPAQVLEALLEGRTVAITHTEDAFGTIVFNQLVYAPAVGDVIIASAVADTGGLMGCLQLTGYLSTNNWVATVVPLAKLEQIPMFYVSSINGKNGSVTLTARDVGAVSVGDYLTVTGVDEDGVPHTWKMYGVKQ